MESSQGGGGSTSQGQEEIGPFPWAKKKGREAALAGEPLDACPYEGYTQPNGAATWSVGLRSAWREGWLSVVQLSFDI
jgi:ribosome modulation factor